jgi:hypothetical protein
VIIKLQDSQARAVLGAMRSVGRADEEALTEVDRGTIEAAAEILFGRDDIRVDSLPETAADRLAEELDPGEETQLAVRLLAVMSLVNGEFDADKTKRVQQYADALGVEEDYLDILHEATSGEIAEATACLVRKNAESFPGLDHSGVNRDPAIPFLPYTDGREQPDLEARYEALGQLPEGTFGRAFHTHFKENGFFFPGHPDALAEGFTMPHDSSHVISGYSTSEQGELLVSTFIAAMHPDRPMAAEILPVLFSWHLGVKLDPLVASDEGGYEPRKFWTAWDRGDSMKVDLLSEEWDFWAAAEEPLDELREAYGLPPAEEGLLA